MNPTLRLRSGAAVSIGLVGAAAVALSGCGSPVAGARLGCSNPNPDPNSLTFAAVLCLDGQSVTRQSDGSTELGLRLDITDADPNAFTVTTDDFAVLTTNGETIAVDDGAARSRASSGDCIGHQPANAGWPLNPGQSLTLPGPLCFNVPGGAQPLQVVWQSDVAVNLPPVATATASATSTGGSSATPTPGGLPADWTRLAIRAADDALAACARTTSLTPSTCPQSISALTGPAISGAETSAEQWTLLNGELQHAVAVRDGSGQVHVYGLYQMDVAFEEAGSAIRPFMNYSGGVAHATMSWDGRSFQSVHFDAYDVAWPQDGAQPPFTRPAQVSDSDVVAAVRAGFQDCVTLQPGPTADASIPDCPQSATHPGAGAMSSAQWTLTADPTQGALVLFDTAHGNFAVTGSYGMNLTYSLDDPSDPALNGAHQATAAGAYTATLVWDGSKLVLLNINGQ